MKKINKSKQLGKLFLFFVWICRCPWLAVSICPAVPPCCAVLFLFVLANFTMATFMDAGILPMGEGTNWWKFQLWRPKLNPALHLFFFLTDSQRGWRQGRRVPRATLQERGREGHPSADEVVCFLSLLQAAAMLALQRVRSLRGGRSYLSCLVSDRLTSYPITYRRNVYNIGLQIYPSI